MLLPHGITVFTLDFAVRRHALLLAAPLPLLRLAVHRRMAPVSQCNA